MLIATQAPLGSTKGNRITAERWASMLLQLGHVAVVSDQHSGSDYDCLIALHATQSRATIRAFQSEYGNLPVVLCLTGTDLHLDLAGENGSERKQAALDSIERSSRIVLLEPECANQLPEHARDKSTVILQSASPVPKTVISEETFDVCVLGHLREEKAPFLAAMASEILPENSKIKVTHIGSALSAQMEQLANTQMERSPRYQWIGELPHIQAMHKLASSRLMVLSSKIEGAPSAVSEAVVNHVPILATRIPAAIGLLGREYPGLFPVGDYRALSKLLSQAETDRVFLAELTSAIEERAAMFSPERETEALSDLIESISRENAN